MRRNGDYFPVRRGQDWGLSPWSEPLSRGFPTPSSFFGGSPWQMMRRMQEDMDRLFEQFFTGQALQGLQGQQWAPGVDVSRDDKEWLVEVDLPGVSQDNIDVQVHNSHLILRAELRQEEQPQGQAGGEAGAQGGEGGQGRQYQRRERRYGYFERVLPLPQDVDEEQVRCDFKDGVLRVHLPRTEQQRPQGRRIPIGEGQSRTPQVAATAGQTGQPSNGNGKKRETAVSGAKGGERSEEPAEKAGR